MPILPRQRSTPSSLSEMTSMMKEHTESYEHLGEVHGWAYDLNACVAA